MYIVYNDRSTAVCTNLVPNVQDQEQTVSPVGQCALQYTVGGEVSSLLEHSVWYVFLKHVCTYVNFYVHTVYQGPGLK